MAAAEPYRPIDEFGGHGARAAPPQAPPRMTWWAFLSDSLAGNIAVPVIALLLSSAVTFGTSLASDSDDGLRTDIAVRLPGPLVICAWFAWVSLAGAARFIVVRRDQQPHQLQDDDGGGGYAKHADDAAAAARAIPALVAAIVAWPLCVLPWGGRASAIAGLFGNAFVLAVALWAIWCSRRVSALAALLVAPVPVWLVVASVSILEQLGALP